MRAKERNLTRSIFASPTNLVVYVFVVTVRRRYYRIIEHESFYRRFRGIWEVSHAIRHWRVSSKSLFVGNGNLSTPPQAYTLRVSVRVRSPGEYVA